MTDKQIITKDVDARVCKFFRNGICSSPINPKCKLCVEISEKMCYYKQLKRKEQECEKFKKQLERKEENYQKLLSKNNKYIHNLVDENVQDISNLARRLEQFKVENDQFKQTLAEIKEIAEKQCNICKALTPIDEYKDCKKCWQGVILQKISEVEK